ncbi:huntingtin-interacting protein 1-related protein-like [Anguilla anguilla]|uniref:huntingtin-interacting protein 1-related protein-like n=1 Tax=Anguilla anguilla TaxID=7936 RepID=UPI0015AB6436|nr:huntingtin-interacting protein 1-related protein-like [Anguilla anguilla]
MNTSRMKSRRAEHSLGAEKEHFDKQQLSSISKAINGTEAPVKEKHVRRIILGTHREKGAFTFWSYAQGLPLASSPILSWKFCHVLHKLLRDGHHNTLQDCARHSSNVKEIGQLWGNLHDRYGQLVALYSRLLCTKMDFHLKHTEIRANLEASDEVLERVAGTDINNVFQITVEVLDYMDAELKLAETVIRQLNTSIAISTTTSGQCRLSPLIQVIQDCSHLYHFTVKLLFKLHACLPADTLQGHRDRFHDQFHSLKGFFNRARDMMYFKRLIQIPKLPDSPPNFLRASALAEHVKPVVVIPDEELPDDEDGGEPLVEVGETPQYHTQFQMQQQQPPPQPQLDIFDQAFGPPNGGFDPKDLQIESLKQEIELLKAELERIKGEAQRYITQLKSQINSLEAELEEQRAQKQRTLVENEQLRMELETLRRHSAENENAQFSFMEAERRAQDSELRYTKLKEKHAELVSSHAELLRKSADTVKMLTVSQQTQEEVARTKQQLAFEVDRVKQDADIKLEEQKFEMDKLRRELEEKRVELLRTQTSLQTNEQSGEKLNSELLGLQGQKEALLRAVNEKEAELSTLRQSAQLQQSSLQQERERSAKEMDELQSKLKDKLSREEQLEQQLLEDQFFLLQGTVTEAENIIQDAVAKLDDPLHLRCTSSPDYLVSRAEAALGSIDKVKQGHNDYLRNMKDASGLLRAITQFSHLAADTIVNGSATAHMAPTDHADRLTDNCRGCGTESLQFLQELKSKPSLQRASPAATRTIIQKILQLAQDLRPKGSDIRQDELGDMVDKEMAATSAAIEEAVRRIDEMMNQARRDTSGVKLEVNERILFSCTDLMKAIHLLVIASKDLQKEIVEGGRGAASIKEFYARNSRWTEGLISASKAVGWGATQMVESADKVVLHTGKYEELIVCSHEIAASTAQLVAASKVKADRSSTRLVTLQQASRRVNEMAANVVASTRTGQDQVEEKDTMDFSGMSLMKLKKEEIESQVRVLELESDLENERVRLGELRRKHYDLAGVPADQETDGNGFATPAPSSPKPAKPSVFKKPTLPQKPSLLAKNPFKLGSS